MKRMAEGDLQLEQFDLFTVSKRDIRTTEQFFTDLADDFFNSCVALGLEPQVIRELGSTLGSGIQERMDETVVDSSGSRPINWDIIGAVVLGHERGEMTPEISFDDQLDTRLAEIDPPCPGIQGEMIISRDQSVWCDGVVILGGFYSDPDADPSEPRPYIFDADGQEYDYHTELAEVRGVWPDAPTTY